MAEHRVVSQDKWVEARKKHLSVENRSWPRAVELLGLAALLPPVFSTLKERALYDQQCAHCYFKGH
jgi:hypothetical protein